MTQHPIRELPDGTRVYSNYSRYKPKSPDKRRYKRRKPNDPRAFFWHGYWYLPRSFLNDDVRVMPDTRPDDEAYGHMAKPKPCKCDVCKRPESQRWKDKWTRDQMRMPSP